MRALDLYRDLVLGVKEIQFEVVASGVLEPVRSDALLPMDLRKERVEESSCQCFVG